MAQDGGLLHLCPAPDQMVVDARELERGLVLGDIATQTLNSSVEVEKPRPQSVIAVTRPSHLGCSRARRAFVTCSDIRMPGICTSMDASEGFADPKTGREHATNDTESQCHHNAD